jgi:hypothetical protein
MWVAITVGACSHALPCVDEPVHDFVKTFDGHDWSADERTEDDIDEEGGLRQEAIDAEVQQNDEALAELRKARAMLDEL